MKKILLSLAFSFICKTSFGLDLDMGSVQFELSENNSCTLAAREFVKSKYNVQEVKSEQIEVIGIDFRKNKKTKKNKITGLTFYYILHGASPLSCDIYAKINKSDCSVLDKSSCE